MIQIPANTAFKAFAPTFTLQGPDTTTAVTVSISVDGTTFTALEDTFTGAQTFSNYATNTFLKCSAAVMCSDDSAKIAPATYTITVTAPSHGQIKVVDMRTKQPVASVTAGDLIECIWFDTTCKWQFVKWTIGGVDYEDERPAVAINANTTIAVTLVELPR